MEPHADGVVLETLDDAIRYVNRLWVMVDTVPTLANRSTHQNNLTGGLEGLVAMIQVIRPIDDTPAEGE